MLNVRSQKSVVLLDLLWRCMVKQFACVFISLCLITWILLSSVSSAEYEDRYETDYDTRDAYNTYDEIELDNTE